MTEYLILIYDAEAPYADATPDLWREIRQSHERFAESVRAGGGKVLDRRALGWTDTAVSVRPEATTPGPFAQTPQALCGYYLIEAPDLDRAVEMSRQCPAKFGGVEVRPVRQVPGA